MNTSNDSTPIDERLELSEFRDSCQDLYNKIVEEEHSPHVLNEKRVKEMCYAVSMLEKIGSDADATVCHSFGENIQSMGSAYIEGLDIVCRDTNLFSQVVRLADGIDVYPLTNGNVRIEFAFHNITVPAKDTK